MDFTYKVHIQPSHITSSDILNLFNKTHKDLVSRSTNIKSVKEYINLLLSTNGFRKSENRFFKVLTKKIIFIDNLAFDNADSLYYLKGDANNSILNLW